MRLLVSTEDTGITGKRKWVEAPANLEKIDSDWVVTAKLPKGTTAWFVNVKSGNLTVSSDYMEPK